MPPAGLPLRASAQGRATVIEPSACWLWPTAKRRVMMSLGKKKQWSSPSGSKMQLLDRLLVGLAGDLLDDPAGDRQRGVVVRHRRAERRDLFDAGHQLDVAGERVVAVAGVVEHVAGPSGGVVEQLQHGDAAGHVLVLQRQLREVGAHRRVEVDAALVDEAHDRRGRERLAGGAELEQRVLVDRQRVLQAGHAVEGVVLLAGVVHADGDARNAEALAPPPLTHSCNDRSIACPCHPLSLGAARVLVRTMNSGDRL